MTFPSPQLAATIRLLEARTNLAGVAQCCADVQEAVHFYGTHKDALGADILLILDHVSKLEKWKAEMLEVERQWDCQALAKLLGATLGDNCRAVIQEQVTELVENNRRQQLLIARLEKVILERNAQLTVLRKGLKEIEQLALSGIKDVAARQQTS